MRFSLPTPFAVAALLAIAPASAQLLDEPPMSEFQAMDLDSNGLINPGEYRFSAAQMFKRMDEDRNGTVTAAEMRATHAAMLGAAAAAKLSAEEKIKEIDSDGDGQLTAVEHAAGAVTSFELLDFDKDWNLSQSEYDFGHTTTKKVQKEPQGATVSEPR